MADIDDTRHVDDLYTFEHNFLAGQATNIDLPSNGVVTANESDDHREIDMAILLKVRREDICPYLLSQMGRDRVSK